MTGNSPQVAYYALGVILLLSSLLATRLPVGKALRMVLAWAGIFAAFFVLFAFRGEFQQLGQRLRAEALGSPEVHGQELRVPIGGDGHFWVNARLNGHDVRFLVDSGATTTTVDRDTASLAGVEISSRRDQYVRTGNGVIRVASGRAEELTVGGITRRNVALEIADNDDLNVLGMNYLSSLARWGVEGRWLVLVS
jgi:aspartyl protease family protein